MYRNWHLTEIPVVVLHWTCEIIQSSEPFTAVCRSEVYATVGTVTAWIYERIHCSEAGQIIVKVNSVMQLVFIY